MNDLSVYKFLVPNDRFYPLKSDASLEYKGCVAVAIAPSLSAAKALIAQTGNDVRWLEIAQVSTFPVTDPRLLAYVML